MWANRHPQDPNFISRFCDATHAVHNEQSHLESVHEQQFLNENFIDKFSLIFLKTLYKKNPKKFETIKKHEALG